MRVRRQQRSKRSAFYEECHLRVDRATIMTTLTPSTKGFDLRAITSRGHAATPCMFRFFLVDMQLLVFALYL